MAEFWWIQGEMALRLFLAAVCGGLIGIERKSRGKGAGIRTHLIVCLAAALMMLISKYGFFDMENFVFKNGEMRHNPTQIAAQIVSGIGFLGAGMIYVNRNTPRGLTTAAGIWATAGVGMAIGAGMYVIGLLSAGVLVLFQILLHKNIKFLHVPNEEQIEIVTTGDYDELQDVFQKYEGQIESFSIEKQQGSTRFSLMVVFDKNPDLQQMMHTFLQNKNVQSVKMNR